MLVSSTYRHQKHGELGAVASALISNISMNLLTMIGDMGDPIAARNANINRELGYDLPPIYMPLLREEGGHTTHLNLYSLGMRHCVPIPRIP